MCPLDWEITVTFGKAAGRREGQLFKKPGDQGKQREQCLEYGREDYFWPGEKE